MLSVEQVANDTLFLQSTSRVGAEREYIHGDSIPDTQSETNLAKYGIVILLNWITQGNKAPE